MGKPLITLDGCRPTYGTPRVHPYALTPWINMQRNSGSTSLAGLRKRENLQSRDRKLEVKLGGVLLEE